MVQIDVAGLLLAFVAAMGIPSTIMGLIVWRLKGHIEEKDTAQTERLKAQQELFLIIVQSTRASIALGELPPRPSNASRMLTAMGICAPPWSTQPVSSTNRRNFWTSRAFPPFWMSERRIYHDL